jgi:hypothetical protein
MAIAELVTNTKSAVILSAAKDLGIENNSRIRDPSLRSG